MSTARPPCDLGRADLLDGDTELGKCHEEAASLGQTRPPNLDEVVKLHFVCFIQKDGHMYELDGRKPLPLKLAPAASPATLLEDAVAHIKKVLLHRNVQRFRGGLVFKAHRLVYHSTLGLRVIKKKNIKKVHPEPKPSTLKPYPATFDPKPSTLNPTPYTLNPKFQTLNPSP